MNINALTVAPKRKARLRTALYATALLIGGGIIGAIVAGPTFGQSGDGPRWQRGWSDGPQAQETSKDESSRWRRDRNESRDDDGLGWRRGFRQRSGDMQRDEDGPRFRGNRAARMLYPGAIERRVNRVLGAVDASTEQRQKVRAIFEAAAGDLHGLGQKRADNRRQIAQALAAETIDRGKIETLRADQVKLSDARSKRLTDAMVEAAEVLTPAQRADLGRRFERRRRG